MSPRYDVPKAAPAPLRLVQLFVNTLDTENRVDWLSTPDELAGWLETNGLGHTDVATESDQRRAVALREALRGLLEANNGALLSPGAVATVNAAAQAGRVGPVLDDRTCPSLEAAAPGVKGALGAIVGVVIEAMLDGSWARLKACRNCHWAFHDYSRNRSARWCSMTLCGNRLKTRSYRRRRA